MHNFIKRTAIQIGFDACGIARAEELKEDAEFLKSWLDKGMHGDMHFLERNFEKRTNPAALVPETKSVVVVLLNYFPQQNQPADNYRIARYAHPKVDYHTTTKQLLSKLENELVQKFGSGIVSAQLQHSFVDSAPILERRWAQRAGLGWIGKHTQLIAPGIGSFCFIGVLLLKSEMEYDSPIRERCGTCTRCIDACPTQALNGRSLDARRCISYQTIENKQPVDKTIRPHLSDCILGCDICAEVCPWNKKWAKPHSNPDLQAVPEIYSFKNTDWQQLERLKFNQIFKHSAIKRAGFHKFKENILMINE